MLNIENVVLALQFERTQVKPNKKITDKTSLMMSVLLCIGILALAATENAQEVKALRSQKDFKRGKKCK